MLSIFNELVESSRVLFQSMNLQRNSVLWREIREKFANFTVSERI